MHFQTCIQRKWLVLCSYRRELFILSNTYFFVFFSVCATAKARYVMGDWFTFIEIVDASTEPRLDTIPTEEIWHLYEVDLLNYEETNAELGRPGKYLAELKRREYSIPLTLPHITTV